MSAIPSPTTHTHLSRVSLLCGGLPDSDPPQVPVVGVHDAIPGDRSGINVQTREPPHLLGRELGRAPLLYAQLLQSPDLNGGELSLALLLGSESVEQSLGREE